MKRFTVIGICLSALMTLNMTFVSAQKDGYIWYFGGYAGLDFNSGTPVPLTNGKLYTNEGSSSIADRNTGQLLFYTDGITIWDKTHNVMQGGSGLYGSATSTQSAVIVPLPGSTTLYYVFTVDAQAGLAGKSWSGYGGVAYSVVDISLNGGLGAVTQLNVPVLTTTSEKIAAVRHCNGRDYWIVIHKWNSNSFYAYQLSNAGLSAPVISSVGTVHQDVGSGTRAETIGYMKFSPNAKKLAVAVYININQVQIFDFDNTTGIISNPVTDTNYPLSSKDGPYGVSFSPDNSRLYVSMFSSGQTSRLYQYNMLAGNGAAIIASRTQIASSNVYGFGALQNAPDGKIYMAKYIANSIDVINNPNGLGSACNYLSSGLSTGSGSSNYGLPCIVESYLVTNVQAKATLTYTGCSGNTQVSFYDSTLTGTISYQWDFGDPASGGANTSTLQNPTHTFSSNGTYTVSITIGNACQSNTYTKTVLVGGGVNISAGADVSICPNDSALLNLTGVPGGSTVTWSPAAGLSCSNCSNPKASPAATTTYYITVNSGGCVGKDTVIVNVNPAVIASATPPDTTICENDFVQLQAGGGTNYQWLPATGLSNATIANPFAFPLVTTTYTVNVSSGSCSGATATVTINVVNAPPTPIITQSHDTLFCSTDPSYTSYQWYNDIALINGATSSSLIITQSGNYNVQVANENGCKIAVGINIVLGLPNNISANAVIFYPNPATSQLAVSSWQLAGKETTINIYDILGKQVLKSEIINRKSEILIDVSSLSSGIYFVQLIGENESLIEKFIKE